MTTTSNDGPQPEREASDPITALLNEITERLFAAADAMPESRVRAVADGIAVHVGSLVTLVSEAARIDAATSGDGTTTDADFAGSDAPRTVNGEARGHSSSSILQPLPAAPDLRRWQPIETCPFLTEAFFMGRIWRHPYWGIKNGPDGHVLLDGFGGDGPDRSWQAFDAVWWYSPPPVASSADQP